MFALVRVLVPFIASSSPNEFYNRLHDMCRYSIAALIKQKSARKCVLLVVWLFNKLTNMVTTVKLWNEANFQFIIVVTLN